MSLTVLPKDGIMARNFLGLVLQCFLMWQKDGEQTFVEHQLICSACLLIISLNSNLETENVRALQLWIQENALLRAGLSKHMLPCWEGLLYLTDHQEFPK